MERYKELSSLAADACVAKNSNAPWLWEEEYAKLITEECIKAGQRIGANYWQHLVDHADIEHNIRRAIGLAKNKTLRDL
jgi:5-methylthioribose kinase